MLEAIRRFFDGHMRPPADAGDDEHALRLATAALFVEMTRQDDTVRAEEQARVVHALQEKFGLPADEAAELMALAEAEVREATDYHQFTSLINDAFTHGQKVRVVEMLWRVANADGHIDIYEEAMVRKVAELLYVPHSAFINAKLRVLAEE